MLDQLYTSYAEILTQAKSQLESVDISDEHIGTMVQELTQNTNFINDITGILSRRIIREMVAESSAVLDAVTKKVLQSVERQLSEHYITELAKSTTEYTASDDFKQAIAAAIASNDDIANAATVRKSLKELLAD